MSPPNARQAEPPPSSQARAAFVLNQVARAHLAASRAPPNLEKTRGCHQASVPRWDGSRLCQHSDGFFLFPLGSCTDSRAHRRVWYHFLEVGSLCPQPLPHRAPNANAAVVRVRRSLESPINRRFSSLEQCRVDAREWFRAEKATACREW